MFGSRYNLTSSNVRDDKEYFYDLTKYRDAIDGKFMRLKLLRRVDNPNLSLNKLLNNGLNIAPRAPIKIIPSLLRYITSNFSDNYQTEIFPEMIVEEDTLFEGIKKQVFVNKYERNSIARKKCIEFHGLNCKLCDTNFATKYGKIGEDFIHIHHLVPIHTNLKQYRVDYKKDLIPVCPNCHAMLHRKINGNEPTVDELKDILKRKK